MSAREVLARIARAYWDSGLDEARPEHEHPAFKDVVLVSGRGGRTLLTLQDCLDALHERGGAQPSGSGDNSKPGVRGDGSEPAYLGDGVYASWDGHHVWLETWDGIQVRDRIALDSTVLHALRLYVERKQGGA